MKWNESGFRPPLCTYRLNWARRTSWGWWDDWDDTVLQTQDSKFEPWRSEAEYATSRSRRLPTILTFTRGWGRNNFVSFKPPRPGTEPRTLAWKAAVLTTTLGPPPNNSTVEYIGWIQTITNIYQDVLRPDCRRDPDHWSGSIPATSHVKRWPACDVTPSIYSVRTVDRSRTAQMCRFLFRHLSDNRHWLNVSPLTSTRRWINTGAEVGPSLIPLV